ncbi:Cytochrome c-type biogenesis protein CcmG/DsbE, thiol:disulfide oxidoreductase [uncultured Candidatus Thioglobus sp.]|nr:Cytochrome c-type biogenesis protein CcmG/DsbE, thiol:disulfide oxidoreductase [uncultured Candidatus Thioglobus sp.]
MFSSVAHSGEALEIDLPSGNTISIDEYKADGKTLFLYLPSGRGFGKGYVSTAQQMAYKGVDVWVADLHSSYMIPKYRSSINRFDINELVELLKVVQNKSFENVYLLANSRGAQLALKLAYQWQQKNPDSNLIKGHIFHSPHLLDGKPALGSTANYVNSTEYSNLPIYLLIPQFSTKYLRSEEIANQLKQGGSAVFTHLLRGIHGGFQMRKLRDLNKQSIQARSNLSDIYYRAIQLMKTVKTPKLLIADKDVNKVSKVKFVEPVLQPYDGKQNILLELKTLNGKTINLQDYKGKVVLLNFWASWCNPCVKEIPSLMRLQQKLSNKNFQILTINVGESKSKIDKFIKKVGLNLPIMLDTKGVAVKDWGVYAYPSNFLLDRNGVIRYGFRGALEWDAKLIVKIIKTLL